MESSTLDKRTAVPAGPKRDAAGAEPQLKKDAIPDGRPTH